MAKTNTGILSAFTGTIAPPTGYVPNMQNFLHSSATVKYDYTPQRAEQLEKIKVCTRFTKAFNRTGFFNKTFPAHGNTGNGYNRAISTLMNQALAGNYPNIHLSYPQVMISKGMLPPALYAAAVAMNDGNIYFNFTDNSGVGAASPNDKLILVAYAETLQQAVFSLHTGLRKDCEAVLQTGALKGFAVETWMGFLGSDETNVSDSVYTGRLQL